MNYTQCKILNHTVEFKLLSSGVISVGVDGSLVGNYPNDSAAIVAALEQVRMAEGMTDRPLLPGRVRNDLRAMVAGTSTISAAEAFDLAVVGRAEHGGQRWVVFDDGSYRHVVDESHFNNCGLAAREADDERRADEYTDWCHRGLWAQDDVAAAVAGLCGLTHVHSSQSGVCGRVDAVAARLESRPVEGTGWYVYVGGEDAGGPFETEADALEHWDN